MNKFACRYAVLQFAPYRETGEFANVGIVLMCADTGYFGFHVQTRKHKRITDFFDELPRNVYQVALQLMRDELQRIADLAASAPERGRGETLRSLFDGLVHPRESLVRFSAPRAVVTEDPATELKRQFDYYVDRAFATPEYVEQAMERRLKVFLNEMGLPRPFRPERVGDDEVYARFPFVQRQGNAVAKIIKPFNLTQSEPMGIYDHGDAWLQKIRRLRGRNLLPADVLFAVAGPPPSDVKRYAAFQEICSDLNLQGVHPIAESDDTRIAAFAAA